MTKKLPLSKNRRWATVQVTAQIKNITPRSINLLVEVPPDSPQTAAIDRVIDLVESLAVEEE